MSYKQQESGGVAICNTKLNTHTAASAALQLSPDCENTLTAPANIVTKQHTNIIMSVNR